MSPAKTRVIRLSAVLRLTRLNGSQLYALVDAGTFPMPLRPSAYCAVWPADEVAAWIATHIGGADARLVVGAPASARQPHRRSPPRGPARHSVPARRAFHRRE